MVNHKYGTSDARNGLQPDSKGSATRAGSSKPSVNISRTPRDCGIQVGQAFISLNAGYL